MNKERLTVEVDTATPGDVRLAMRGDVDIAADETLADAYAAGCRGGCAARDPRLRERRLHQLDRDRADRPAPGRGPPGPPRGHRGRPVRPLPRDLPDHPPVRLPDDRRRPVRDVRPRGGTPDDRHHRRRDPRRHPRRSCGSTARSPAGSEPPIMAAYAEADGAKSIVLDFSDLDYMNSGGIGLLVTLLVRTQRAGQRLLAVGPVRPLPPDPRADPPRRGDRHPRRRSRPRSRPPQSA